jgi:CheY-like chemotaxis protein
MINKVKAGPRVLVVEDVEETRDGIEALLSVCGYCVTPARDEEDAVSRARRERPDLVLVSLAGTPADVTGIALRIKQRTGLSEGVPVVIFCLQTVAEGAEVEVQSNVYVTRPDNFDQLRALLNRLLRKLSAAS